MRTAASVVGAGATLPAVNCPDRNRHFFCQSAADACAALQAQTLLFVGGCVRMNLHTCSFLVRGYQEDYRMHLNLRKPTVHNDMKLDK